MIEYHDSSIAIDTNGQLTQQTRRIKRYLLKPISLQLTEQRIGVIGANGSGKSSFVRLINGLIQPSSGSVRVNGVDTRKELAKVRQQVGFVFQNPEHQIVYPLVAEDVAFGLRNQQRTAEEIERLADQALRQFGLADRAEQTTYTLSGGQKQMLALAGVVAMQPAIIVLDEPTTLLDLRNRHIVNQHLQSLKQQIINVTHHLEDLMEYDRVLCFDAGSLVDDGRPADVIARYRDRMCDTTVDDLSHDHAL